MHPTKNNLSLELRTAMAGLLNARLADATDLKSQLKHAHWNVKGSDFIALHELFDQVAARTEIQIDDLAERLVQLGGTANGTIRMAAAATSLPDYPAGITAGLDHIKAVAHSLADFGGKLRSGIDDAAAAGDADTADLLTEISRSVDKDLWFVEAHLH